MTDRRELMSASSFTILSLAQMTSCDEFLCCPAARAKVEREVVCPLNRTCPSINRKLEYPQCPQHYPAIDALGEQDGASVRVCPCDFKIDAED